MPPTTSTMHREHPVRRFAEVVDADTQFIDVREIDEFACGSLPGAVNIPLGTLPARMAELDPNRRTVLLCQSSKRSGRAAELLAGSGFRDVVNLTGGMLAMR